MTTRAHCLPRAISSLSLILPGVVWRRVDIGKWARAVFLEPQQVLRAARCLRKWSRRTPGDQSEKRAVFPGVKYAFVEDSIVRQAHFAVNALIAPALTIAALLYTPPRFLSTNPMTATVSVMLFAISFSTAILSWMNFGRSRSSGG
jgi:hypothetical protein